MSFVRLPVRVIVGRSHYLRRSAGSLHHHPAVNNGLLHHHHQTSRTLSSAFTSNDLFRNTFSARERGRFTTEFRILDSDPVNVHLNFRFGPEISGCGLNVRFLHSSGSSGEKASSKIEETVNR